MNKKIPVAIAKLPAKEVGEFLNDLMELEVGKEGVSEIIITPDPRLIPLVLPDKICNILVMALNENAEYLLRASFKDGQLKKWGEKKFSMAKESKMSHPS